MDTIRDLTWDTTEVMRTHQGFVNFPEAFQLREREGHEYIFGFEYPSCEGSGDSCTEKYSLLTVVKIGHGPTEDSSCVRENTPDIEVHRVLLDVRPIPVSVEFSDKYVRIYCIFSPHVPNI